MCALRSLYHQVLSVYSELLAVEIITEEKPLSEESAEALFEEPELIGEELELFFEELPPEDELLLFDVEVPGVSCSTPLLTQPVKVSAAAPTRREMMIFFIILSLSSSNIFN